MPTIDKQYTKTFTAKSFSSRKDSVSEDIILIPDEALYIMRKYYISISASSGKIKSYDLNKGYIIFSTNPTYPVTISYTYEAEDVRDEEAIIKHFVVNGDIRTKNIYTNNIFNVKLGETIDLSSGYTMKFTPTSTNISKGSWNKLYQYTIQPGTYISNLKLRYAPTKNSESPVRAGIKLSTVPAVTIGTADIDRFLPSVTSSSDILQFNMSSIIDIKIPTTYYIFGYANIEGIFGVETRNSQVNRSNTWNWTLTKVR